ncbi:MAG: KpsF/GutQ family sugar-phosphate isomerase [Bacteroidetes bacterium]|nr:KpsF/GutQ family sugar-phosphate isomerase [Bacteroidota bacterium]
MGNKEDIKRIGIETIEKEYSAIINLKKSVNDDFVHCVELIYNSSGRVIVTGIGKSANIATKIVSTLNSTGTPAIFMHAADAIHGDLGIIKDDDIIICVSKSGETSEIKVLVSLLKTRKNSLIAIVGNINSYLAKQADYVIDVTVEKEACPNNLAPTASTTAQMVMGDALAMALLKCRGFTAEDFAKYHPGGSLGKKLYLKVSGLYIRNEVPEVDINDDIRSVIVEISSKRLGATIVSDKGKIVGIVTDGDLRRMLEKNTSLDFITAKDVMTLNPKTIDSECLVVNALDVMRSNNITQLAVLKNDKYVGVIHLHDILKEGIL